MMIVNGLGGLAYVFMGEQLKAAGDIANADWVLPLFTVLMFFNAACAVALFFWKRWGFWGFCVSATIAAIVNSTIMGMGLRGVFSALFGVGLLFALMHLGNGPTKAWNQLE